MESLKARRKAIKAQALLEATLDIIEKALEMAEDIEAHATQDISAKGPRTHAEPP